MDPDNWGAYLKLAQTESSSGERGAEACLRDCNPGDWSCWSECMGDDGQL